MDRTRILGTLHSRRLLLPKNMLDYGLFSNFIGAAIAAKQYLCTLSAQVLGTAKVHISSDLQAL